MDPAAVAFMVAVGILVLLFMVLVNVVAIGTPLSLLLLLVFRFSLSNEPPCHPQLSDLVGEDAVRTRDEVWRAANISSEALIATYKEGLDNGIFFRAKNSNEGLRFREHATLGRTLNRRLAAEELKIRALAHQLAELVFGVAQSLPDWETPVASWQRQRRLSNAVIPALIAYVLAAILAYSALASQKTFVEDMMPYFPRSLAAPAAAAGGCAIAVGLIAYFLTSQRAPSEVFPEYAAAWNHIAEEWAPVEPSVLIEQFIFEDEYEIYQLVGSYKPQGDSGRSEISEDWPEILGISRSATTAEIRAAWIGKLKAYHPDRVAGLGARLRQLAEEETKKINRAYEEAMRAARA